MTTHYGSNFTIADAPTPSTVLATEQWGGRVKAIADSVTLAARALTSETIYMGKMPKGALPMFGVLRYSGSRTSTLSIGYAADTDALGTATAIGTTKTQVLYPASGKFRTPLTQDQDIYVSVNTTYMVTSDVLDLHYLYTKD